MFALFPHTVLAQGSSFEIRYWRPSLNEAERPVGLIWVDAPSAQALPEPNAWIAIAPVPEGLGSLSASLDIGLLRGYGLGLGYSRLLARDSVGSMDEPFDFLPYAPAGPEASVLSLLTVWDDVLDIYHDSDTSHHVMLSKAVSVFALDARIMRAVGTSKASVKWGLGARKAAVGRTLSTGVGMSKLVYEVPGPPEEEPFSGQSFHPLNGDPLPVGTLMIRALSEVSQSISLVGPSASISGAYTVSDRLSLSGSLAASYLRTTVIEHGSFDAYMAFLDANTGQSFPLFAIDTRGNDIMRKLWVPTLDFEVGMTANVTRNVALKAGYCHSRWFSVPNPHRLSFGQTGNPETAEWQDDGNKPLSYGGLTLGVQIRF